MKYNNYHKHDCYGNFISLDVVTKPEDYCKRAIELNHTSIFTTNHGFQGNLFETVSLGKKYGLKVIIGSEIYYVEDRLEKDRSNRHMILIALNNNGVRQLNSILSEANSTGFYYKPRIDRSLLFSLNADNFIVTTACIAGIWNNEELILELKSHFGNHLFLEVQDHNVESQKQANKIILEMHYKHTIPIIHANDSHYIYPEDNKYRELFLKAKGIIYEEEEKFILDYPDSDTIIQRYKKQNILNEQEILEALNNTLIFDTVEDFTLINDEIKLPSICDNPKKEMKRIIEQAWKEEKINLPFEELESYKEAIRYEADIINKTNMEDYFIIDHKMVKLAQEKYGGTLTNTGRRFRSFILYK